MGELRAVPLRRPTWRLDAVRALAPTAFVAVNAVAFCLVQPGVPDLWAARARASAAAHGVGLTYWFSWFGGSAPGAYSVLTPVVSGLVGAEVVAAVAAVAISVIVVPLVRDTAHATAAAWVAAAGVVVNLWCGRVPFLLGAAFAVASVACVRRRHKLPATLLAVLSVLASPVAGAFLGLALSGVVVAPRMRAYRSTALVTAAAGACVPLVVLVAVFGTPGPEPFPPYLLAETGIAIALMLLLAPTSYLATTLTMSALAGLVVFAVPNALGANFARLALFCLPAAAVALSRRRLPTVVALVTPILALGALTSVSAVRSAAEASSQASYYAPLAAELDTQPRLAQHRLELVATARAAYTALIGHAILARGWETQSFLELDAELVSGHLDAAGYRAWLDDNAVGLVAVDTSREVTRESWLVEKGLPYLRLVWRYAGWRLYEVRRPTPIVAAPARLAGATQAEMRVHVPCACRTLVRVRWSPFLQAAPALPARAPDGIEDGYRPELGEDRTGWTTLTTNRPGTYVLRGLL